MASIGVAHADLMSKGGGEGVCLHVIEALQDDHDVALLTLTQPDASELDQYFEVDISHVAVERPPVVERLLDRLDLPLYNARNALLNRFVQRRADSYDLIFGTDNEISTDTSSIQYIHTPRFGRLVTTKRVGEDSFVDHLYDRLSYRVGGYDAKEIRSSKVLTNSQWMANIVQDTYSVRPKVVYPPVNTDEFDPCPWEKREKGFVTVGRLARYKNIKDTIRIVDGVRERGHDVHQHIIGPSSDETYHREITVLADDRDYVHVEGELSRAELTEMVSSHQYGLHGKRHEHFGMAVAEMVAGGAIPFVPDNGGQQDIVGRREELLYRTPTEAVEKIDRVFSQLDGPPSFRQAPEIIERRFGYERFRDTVQTLVDEALM